MYIFIFTLFLYNQIMITIDFSRRGTLNLTEFLYSQLKSKIVEGNLRPNQRLPSKRSLSSHLGVSVITVQNAYQQLIDEGYVYSAEKRGYFVTPLDTGTHAIPLPGKSPIPPQHSSPEGGTERIPPHSQDSHPQPDLINLQDIHIHRELFPFTLWSRLMRKVLQDSKTRILSPLPPEGLWELRLAVATYLGTFRNMAVDPEQVVIGAGTEYLYSLVLQLLGRNLRYGVEDPGYQKPARIMEAMGVDWTPVAMDTSGVTVEELVKQQVDAVLVSPAHHFPSGIIMPIKRRQELLAWARGGGQQRFIIEDDYDSEFRFTGRPLETLFSLEEANQSLQAATNPSQLDSNTPRHADTSKESSGHVIYLNTFTKTLTPSLRISYMVLPWNLVQRFRQQLGFYSCTVSSIEQLTLARFIQEGHYEKHLARKKNHYRNVRDNLILQLGRSALASRISISGKDAGLHFLLRVNTTSSNQQLQEKLKQAGVQVALLHHFFHHKTDATQLPLLVVSYSALKKEQIPSLVERLCRDLNL